MRRNKRIGVHSRPLLGASIGRSSCGNEPSPCQEGGYRVPEDASESQPKWTIKSAAIAIGIVLLIALVIGATCSSSTISRDDDGKPWAGEDWPFTVESVSLRCAGSAVWIVHEGLNYPINGTARVRLSTGLPLGDLWRNDPDVPGLKINIGPEISEGLKL
ncbi:MAG: DUF2511 domain-containing protein [Candidatus Dadabacteria bacterium]|nr:DUF2511 domain-containing protein [Candidatus Dadabacteria bacterium]